MKTKAFLFGLTLQMSLALHGQIATTPEAAAELTTQSRPLGYLIGERGLNHRVWNKVVAETNQFGWVSYATNKAYVELQSGLHYRDAQGVMRESTEQIEILPGGGAAALQGQHQVYFPSDIYNGVIEVVSADGRRLKSRPLGISYFDGTNNVLVAHLTNSVGLILPSGNQVIYTNAFTDFAADLVINYRKGGVEADVVFREQPPSPNAFGMDARNARLQLWTEFIDTAAPQPKEARTNRVEGLIDRDLKFGALQMVRGRAFALTNNPTRSLTNNPAARDRVSETPVYKTWQQQDGRTFLIEELPYRRVRTDLEQLRTRAAATNRMASVGKLSPKLELPPLRMAQASSDATIQLAQADLLTEPGYVLDYVMVNSTNELHLTAGTYYVVGEVYADSLSYCNDAVVKYDPGTTSAGPGRLIVSGFGPDLSCYNYYNPGAIIFTVMDDDECGETISGSTGNPCAVAGTGMVSCGGEFSFGGRCRYLGAALNPGTTYITLTGWSFEDCLVALYSDGSTYNMGYTVPDCLFTNCLVCVYREGGNSPIYLDLQSTTVTNCTTLYSGNAGTDEFNSFTVLYPSFSVPTGANLYVDLVADPITAYGPYATGVKVNVNGGEPGLYWGDQASFNLEYYYNGYMGPLPGNGRLLLGGGGQTVSSLTITYTNGLMGLNCSYGIIPDGDGDGLLDVWEQQYFGNLNQTATGDYDGDGLSNLAEYDSGTNNPVQFDSVRLSYWNFDPHSPSYLTGDRGQSPLDSTYAVNVAGVSTNAVALSNTTAGLLEYRIGETTGCTNILPRQGTVAFWYKPAWGSTSAGGTGPGVEGRLIEMGAKNGGTGWWSLLVDSTGTNLSFTTQSNTTPSLQTNVAAVINWASNTWHQIVFTYSAADSCLYVDGQAVATNGLGVSVIYSDSSFYGNGFFLGSDYQGNNRGKGSFDELEIYNYPFDSAAAAAAMDADDDQLPDAWEFNHFGDFSQTAGGDYDNDGTDNITEQASGSNPNDIRFRSRFPDFFVNQTNVSGYCEVESGVPFELAVLVNNTNLTAAQWLPYTSNFVASLGSTDGLYTVRVALRGRDPAFPPVWEDTEITLDRAAPVLAITNPASPPATVTKPYLQLQGFANEPLASLAYDISNAFGFETNLDAFVTDQAFDTNQFDFTTNWIQAYDVELATNANLITLRVTDRAGNATSTNLTVILNYSAATNPIIKLTWPTNGLELCGDNFTLRGWTDDEAATVYAAVTSTNGGTSTVTGEAERSGVVWAENVPLNSGTNWLTLSVTNSAGLGSTTNLFVVKSDMTLTVTWIEGDLWEPPVTVYGAISEPDYCVWVNGVKGTNYGDGTWSVANVPVSAGGVASFDVSAIPPGGGDPMISTNVEKTAAIKCVKHTFKEVTTQPESTFTYTKSYQATWEPDGEGNWVERDYQGEYTVHHVGYYGYWTNELRYIWSATNATGGKYSDGVYQGRIVDLDNGERAQVLSVPHYDWDGGVSTVDHYYANGVKYSWTLTNDYGQTITSKATVEARTEMKLFTGGKAKVKRKGLIHLTGGAREWRQAAIPFWLDTPSTNVPPPKVRILAGRVFGWKNLSGLGELYQALPEGAVLDLNMSVPFLKHYYAWASVVKHQLVHETVNPALTDTNLARTKLGVGEEVGFRFDPTLPTNGTWSVTAGGLAMTSGPTNLFTAPSNAANATLTVTVLGQKLKESFKVVEPSGVDTNHTVITSTYTNSFSTNRAGAAMGILVFLKPTDVSFYRVCAMEVGEDATNVTGYYSDPYFSTADLSHKGIYGSGRGDAWFHISPTNSWERSGPGRFWDYCYEELPTSPTAPAWTNGSYTWNIPGAWKVADSINDSSPTNSMNATWQQVVSVDPNGTVTITKFGSITVTRSTNNVTTPSL